MLYFQDNAKNNYIDVYQELISVKQQYRDGFPLTQEDIMNLVTYQTAVNNASKKYNIEYIPGDTNYYIDQKINIISDYKVPEIDVDSVISSVDINLSNTTCIENIKLCDWNSPIKVDLKNKENCNVYGHPKNVLLYYIQGNDTLYSGSIELDENNQPKRDANDRVKQWSININVLVGHHKLAA